jgi:serine/threonine-protein kinase
MPAFSSTDELTAFSNALTGQYEVEREIGRGGMGVVYLARDLRLDRMVAIKTLPPAMAGDATVRERFLREARTAARLAHPNIVPIHRADEIDGQVFFVMGFVDGDSLAAKLANGPLSPRDTLPILRDVTAALGYAHRHGEVHRDVKTENILLDMVSGRAMVTDFGIARVAAAAPLTATGQVLGTVYYLSPEQVTDEGVDERSDIYALGVVGFAMLSGRFPFDGTSASAVLVSHVLRPAPALASVAPHVPPGLAAIIDRCLAKDPAQRYQSCADLDDALERVRGEASTVTVVPSRGSTPLLSDTEARQVLGRAAALNEGTDARPIALQSRDHESDARRQEGFKTSVLRNAAAEAGIDPKYVEQAFVEHGLRPLPQPAGKPDRRATKVIHDLTRRPAFYEGDPTELHYEMVFNGEAPEDDYDLLIEIIRKHWPDSGMGGMMGKALTWKGTTMKGRTLEVSVQPRGGRTTLQVKENFRKIANLIYGASAGLLGLGVGGALAGNAAEHGNPGAAVFSLCLLLTLGLAVGGTTVKGLSERRQKAVRKLVEELGAQTQESIEAKYIK